MVRYYTYYTCWLAASVLLLFPVNRVVYPGPIPSLHPRVRRVCSNCKGLWVLIFMIASLIRDLTAGQLCLGRANCFFPLLLCLTLYVSLPLSYSAVLRFPILANSFDVVLIDVRYL